MRVINYTYTCACKELHQHPVSACESRAEGLHVVANHLEKFLDLQLGVERLNGLGVGVIAHREGAGDDGCEVSAEKIE